MPDAAKIGRQLFLTPRVKRYCADCVLPSACSALQGDYKYSTDSASLADSAVSATIRLAFRVVVTRNKPNKIANLAMIWRKPLTLHTFVALYKEYQQLIE